ncbi:MAG: hypothetical protein AAFO87_09060, partial [Cyanobacteria bacterium J06607_6]
MSTTPGRRRSLFLDQAAFIGYRIIQKPPESSDLEVFVVLTSAITTSENVSADDYIGPARL